MQPNRTYSYEHHDDQDFSNRTYGQQQQHYHNTPMREVVSPPPQYTSSPPLEPAGPVPLSHAQPYSIHDSRAVTNGDSDPVSLRYSDRSPSPPPPPPPHRTSPERPSGRDSIERRPIGGAAIPMDEFARPSQDGTSLRYTSPERLYTPGGSDRRGPHAGYSQPFPIQNNLQPGFAPSQQRPNSYLQENPSFGSTMPLANGAATPGSITPTATSDMRSSRYSGRSIPLDDYTSNPYRNSRYSHLDSPYRSSSHNLDATVSGASIDPRNIADDGDDDFAPLPKNHPSYLMQQRNGVGKTGATVAVGAAAASGGMLGGLFGRSAKNKSASGTYQPVNVAVEKSDWLSRDNQTRKRNGWLCGIGIGVVLLIVLSAGIIGGVMGTRAYKQGSGSINNANDDTSANGDLDINSAEIKKLLNNANLHKVFPGMDYTPWGVQYPLCETYPPSQNNVTRDVAVLSQLTNTIRLYGTDCNQTEMVLHAIDKLKLKNVKVWLGVWIDTNQTTTARQLSKMYTVLNGVKDKSIFKGAIIGNEALYRAGETKAQSKTELIQILKDVKSNFTTLGYKLPIATSDLGDNWDGDLAGAVDYVMSNIHPFFAGVSAEKAAAWTWNFWNDHDRPLTANLPNVKQVISETGWPSGGGTDCGGTDGTCAAGQTGAVASVANMNTFMSNWVCQALNNGTDYFWFEAFDEPWKVQYNTAGKEWEDKWGLMDAARNLKSGVKIPSCGGKTVS